VVKVSGTPAKLGLSIEKFVYTRLHAFADRRAAKTAVKHGGRPKPAHLLTGERGELEAYFYLRSLGYTVTARRWLSGRHRGDVDLVAWDGDTLVFFEVKARTSRDLAPAEIQVDREKRNQLRLQAAAYLRRFPELHRESLRVRFDVIAVYLLPGGTEFEHYADSFPLVAPKEDWASRF